MYFYVWKRAYAEALAYVARGGECMESSIINHRHPNVFCGIRAPHLVISTTAIGNQTKKAYNIKLFISKE